MPHALDTFEIGNAIKKVKESFFNFHARKREEAAEDKFMSTLHKLISATRGPEQDGFPNVIPKKGYEEDVAIKKVQNTIDKIRGLENELIGMHSKLTAIATPKAKEQEFQNNFPRLFEILNKLREHSLSLKKALRSQELAGILAGEIDKLLIRNAEFQNALNAWFSIESFNQRRGSAALRDDDWKKFSPSVNDFEKIAEIVGIGSEQKFIISDWYRKNVGKDGKPGDIFLTPRTHNLELNLREIQEIARQLKNLPESIEKLEMDIKKLKADNHSPNQIQEKEELLKLLKDFQSKGYTVSLEIFTKSNGNIGFIMKCGIGNPPEPSPDAKNSTLKIMGSTNAIKLAEIEDNKPKNEAGFAAELRPELTEENKAANDNLAPTNEKENEGEHDNTPKLN